MAMSLLIDFCFWILFDARFCCFAFRNYPKNRFYFFAVSNSNIFACHKQIRLLRTNFVRRFVRSGFKLLIFVRFRLFLLISVRIDSNYLFESLISI